MSFMTSNLRNCLTLCRETHGCSAQTKILVTVILEELLNTFPDGFVARLNQ